MIEKNSAIRDKLEGNAKKELSGEPVLPDLVQLTRDIEQRVESQVGQTTETPKKDSPKLQVIGHLKEVTKSDEISTIVIEEPQTQIGNLDKSEDMTNKVKPSESDESEDGIYGKTLTCLNVHIFCSVCQFR